MKKNENSINGDPLEARFRPWLLIAAYDVSIGESSEGYVAFNVLKRLATRYRVVLITRHNNQQRLLAHPAFQKSCPGVYVLGFDLPRWARWWKRGARFYGLYAYLWQVIWPLVLRRRSRIRSQLSLVHVLNFHNDSIPSTAWLLRRPVVWGPINHNEALPKWRRVFWPSLLGIKHRVSFFARCVTWRCDPLLWLAKRRVNVILSAGSWVDRRLHIHNREGVIRLSQLGVDCADFSPKLSVSTENFGSNEKRLVYAGRLDWIKGVDIAIESLNRLPQNFNLLVIGKGPAESKLKELVKKLKLEGRVDFLLPVSRPELAEVYANADLFLFTSAEVAGLAWIEALACGLPVVGLSGETEIEVSAEDLPGLYLASPGNDRASHVENYANVIAHAAVQKTDRRTISNAALKRYAWDRMITVIEHAYEKAQAEI